MGFPAAAVGVALGVSSAESGGYSDAVGDLTLIDDKWGPSVGLFQVRSLRDPLGFSVADRYRYAWALRSAWFNAQAALAISNGGTDFSPWSVFRSGAYLPYVGRDYVPRTGHVNADRWNA